MCGKTPPGKFGWWGEMLVVETVARIRRAHLVQGKSIKAISREMGIARNTIRKVLRSGETSFAYEREVQPRPKLGQWTGGAGEASSGQRPAVTP